MNSEAQILRSVLAGLKFRVMTGDVAWYTRLQSLQMGKIRVGTPGFPDILALVNDGSGGIVALFIEVKRSGVTKLRYEQGEFFINMAGRPKILCRIINDKNQLGQAINEAKRC